MPDDALPTYLWGDTISLRMEIEHEANMSHVWAIFRKEGDTFEFQLHLSDRYDSLRLTEWQGARRLSQVTLESEVERANQLPGDYVLVAVRGTPRYRVESSGEGVTDYLEFDFPEDVRLRIAQPPPASRPRVAFFEFEPPS
jgi:hypothetical protein